MPHSYKEFNHKLLLLSSAMTLALSPGFSSALPTGGSVSQGSATISSTATQTTVNQTTPNAVINWTGFNTTKGQSVEINDPSSSSITLNRVSGGATSFDGTLNSNGNVWVVNPSGILFGKDAEVNVGGLLATTSNITDGNFMSGNYNFTPGGGSPSASVSNQGIINISNAGLTALVAPNVSNSGTINALTSKIALASGDAYTVDLYGDGLINLSASNAVTQQTLSNTGHINDVNSSVSLTAAQASNVLDNVINLNGYVEATGLTASGDTINYGASYTPASAGGNFTLTAPGNITVSSGAQIGSANSPAVSVLLDSTSTGSVTVNAASINTSGGSFDVVSQNNAVNLSGSSVNLSGSGGNGNSTIVAGTVFNASNGYIENASDLSITNRIYSGYNTTLATTTGSGIALNNFTLTAENNISLMAAAPGNFSGATAGVNINNSTLSTAADSNSGLNIGITGIGSTNANGASTGVIVTGSNMEATNGVIGIVGYFGLSAGPVKGAANGVTVSNSTLGSTGTAGVGIEGGGGNAPGYASNGIVIGNTSIIGNATNNPYSPINNPSEITLNGSGGTGTSAIGVDVTGGVTLSEQPGNYGLTQISGEGGTSSAGGSNIGVSFTGPYNAGSHSNNITADTVYVYGSGGTGTGTGSSKGSGVYLANTDFTFFNGTIKGQGGTGSGTSNYGVELAGNTLFNDIETFKLTATGTGSSLDIMTDENSGQSLNLINDYNNTSSYTLDPTRNKANYSYLIIE